MDGCISYLRDFILEISMKITLSFVSLITKLSAGFELRGQPLLSCVAPLSPSTP